MTPSGLPVLTGERVRLVPVSLAVARAVVGHDGRRGGGLDAALAPDGLAAAPGWPHADTADALRGLAEHGADGDDGGWLITVGQAVVGDCGWRGGPDPHGSVEIGYGLAAPSRGYGLAGEAVNLLAAWCEQQPGVRQLEARVLPGNLASWRLLLRLGFQAAGPSGDLLLFRRPAPGRPGTASARQGDR